MAELPTSTSGPIRGWQRWAACVGTPMAWWIGGTPPKEAKDLCRRCPVRRSCLAEANEIEGRLAPTDAKAQGFRAGLSAPQRFKLRQSLPDSLSA